MSKYQQVWKSLEDDEYRREYAADVGTGLAFQIKLIREKNGWTQGQLAEHIGSQQPTISQWENPNYGDFSLNSLKSLATAFDLALMVKFVPFSELVEWDANLTPQRLAPPSFREEVHAGYQANRLLAEHVGEPVTVAANDVELRGLLSAKDLAALTAPYVGLSEDTLEPTRRWSTDTAVEPQEKNHARAA